ncbi:MAG: phosphopantothenate/pantothenate synthetase [Candidatus Lokiarchaeota archaeon]|nr:phosphopantothenate/pantothenate synthetase [Candidatus Harpocratesius repetitus]
MKSPNGNPIIPADHPRAESLHYRHLLVDAMHKKIVTPSGLCAHGRGEAFDYLIGEQTISPAEKSIQAAVATLIKAKHPVISVNGNVAALVGKELVELSQLLNIPLEINIFYQAEGRIEAITELLRDFGAKNLLGIGDFTPKQLSKLSSNRRIVDPRGIYQADVVVVPLEDGDRTEALIAAGKFVIAIDLNPLSRTAQQAHITIVDNIIRVIPKMVEIGKILQNATDKELNQIASEFDQSQNLKQSLEYIIKYLKTQIK